MTLIKLRYRNEHGKPQRDALHEVLGIAPGGASPRGSTYYKTFQHCPREFFIKYILGWRPAVPHDALTTGILWHHVLECYYRAMMLHQLKSAPAPKNPAWLYGGCNEGAATAYAALDRVEQYDGWHEIGGIVRKMFDHYLECFDRRDRFRIIAVEETLQYIADDPYTCRADMIVEDYDRGGMWFWEHKSARSLTDDLLSAYDMDLQILGEWWLITNVIDRSAYPELRGVVINICTKPKTATSDTTLKAHRHEVCPSEGHIAAFGRTIGTRKILLAAAEQAGWPMYLGNCAGATRGYSKCECYDLCHQYPQYEAQDLKRLGVEHFSDYTIAEESYEYADDV